jgi:hypothetical protein
MNGTVPKTKGLETSEDPSGPESLNFVEDLDYIYNIQQKTHSITSEQMRQIKQRSVDTARLARMEMLNSMDEEAKNKLRKEKYIQYMRRNKAPKLSQPSASEPQRKPWSRPSNKNTSQK